VPGPPVVSPLVNARTWYEWTGQRQWLVAPTLELLDWTARSVLSHLGRAGRTQETPMTTTPPDTSGARLRRARERLGLQQIELGKQLGVTGSYISRIERDLVSIRPMALRLAEALDVSVDYLLLAKDTPQREATASALFESTQDELVSLRLLRLVIDDLPAEERVRLIHFLIKQAGVYKDTFLARNQLSEPDSDQ